MSSFFEYLLPIKVFQKDAAKQQSDYYRLTRHLLPSLVKFSGNSGSILNIVASDEDISYIKNNLGVGLKGVSLRYWDENLFLANIDVRGWVKQQIIKIVFAKYATSRTYLTLDSDVIFLSKPEKCFVPSPWMQSETKKSFNAHRKWWLGSEVLYGKSLSVLLENLPSIQYLDGLYSPRMGVTPQIIYVEVMLSLIGRLRYKYGDDWVGQIASIRDSRLPWTEYSLYWMHYCDEFCMSDEYKYTYPLGNDPQLFAGLFERHIEYRNDPSFHFLREVFINGNDVPACFYVANSTMVSLEVIDSYF